MLPFLINKTSLKSANAKLDLAADSADLFGKCVNIQTTPSRHYFLNLNPNIEAFQTESGSLTETDLKKLHVQF